MLLYLCALLMFPMQDGKEVMLAKHWNLENGQARFLKHRNRNCIIMDGGVALLNDVEMTHGEVEMEVYTSGQTAFPGILFRAQSAKEAEVMYLRLQKSGKPDAIQYCPRYNSNNAWQLYHGKDYEAKAVFQPDGWTHVKIRFQGPSLMVYIDGSLVLNTKRLVQKTRPGSIGISGRFGVAFTNVKWRELEAGPVKQQQQTAKTGALRNWTLSPVFKQEGHQPTYPEAMMKNADAWLQVVASPHGLLHVDRYRQREPRGKSTVIARNVIQSKEDRSVQLNFGYSDNATFFLNGTPIYTGKNGFRSRAPGYLGLVDPQNESIYLPLKQGANELVVVVDEVFGGWGLYAVMEQTKGLIF